jgi:hypothetical protein
MTFLLVWYLLHKVPRVIALNCEFIDLGTSCMNISHFSFCCSGSKVWSCPDWQNHLSSQLWVMTYDLHRTFPISIVVVWNLLNSEVNEYFYKTWKWEMCMGLSLCLILVSRPFRKRNSLQDHLVLDIFSKIVWSFSCTSISRFISIKFIPWVIRPILSYMNVISNWASIGVFEPCALNAEIQRFVLSFSISYWDLIKFPYFADGCMPLKEGLGGW